MLLTDSFFTLKPSYLPAPNKGGPRRCKCLSYTFETSFLELDIWNQVFRTRLQELLAPETPIPPMLLAHSSFALKPRYSMPNNGGPRRCKCLSQAIRLVGLQTFIFVLIVVCLCLLVSILHAKLVLVFKDFVNVFTMRELSTRHK